MSSRPQIQAKNSSGKEISLLNDDSTSNSTSPQFRTPDWYNYANQPYQASYDAPGMVRSHSNGSSQSYQSDPRTPGLVRSQSSDSNTTHDSSSPITPAGLMDRPMEFIKRPSYTSAGYTQETPYEDRRYAEYSTYYPQVPQLQVAPGSQFSQRESAGPEIQTYGLPDYSNGVSKGSKKYPCRHKDSHHCDKMFTTSGHASRHSKIHVAEKAVNCTYPNCPKKFTRADNMKQHLETHNKSKSKDRSRSQSSSKSTLTKPAGIHKSIPSRSSSTTGTKLEESSSSHSAYYPPMQSPTTRERYPSPEAAFRQIDSPYHFASSSSSTGRPMLSRRERDMESGGLDALAAVAEMRIME